MKDFDEAVRINPQNQDALKWRAYCQEDIDDKKKEPEPKKKKNFFGF